MPDNKHLKLLLAVCYVALALLAAWLTARFFLVWLLPFLTAYALAALLERPLRFLMCRLALPRRAAAGVCTVLLALALLGLLGLGAWRLWYELALLLDRLPALLSALPRLGAGWEKWVYRFLTAAPAALRPYLTGALDGLLAQSASLPPQLYGRLVRWAAGIASAVPDVILFLFTTALALYFTAASRPVLLAFLRRQVPKPWRSKLRRGVKRLKGSFGGWLKAQGILMLITGGELTLGFLILDVDYFLLLAALVALVDALPVFGTGTVLLPWAAVSLLGGSGRLGVGLLLLYGTVSAVRALLEPKLVGDRVGLPPLAALCAMYVGFQIFGVLGMIFAPLLLLFLKELHDSGFLRLWRD